MANEHNYYVEILHDDNDVPTGCECPKCGENDADNLLIDENENVSCQQCGTTYNLGKVGTEHSKDSDCTVDPATDCCTVCGVVHGDPCLDCGGRAFHNNGCPILKGVN